MSINYKIEFYKLFKHKVAPQLITDGFVASGQVYRRTLNDVIHIISIQGNKYGGSCCVNLGLHLSFLPAAFAANVIPDGKELKPTDCEFRTRLAPVGKTDYWWKFKGNGLFGNTHKSIDHLFKTYTEVGSLYFNTYSNLDTIIAELPIAAIETNKYITALGGLMPVKAALIMARIYKHLGDQALTQSYARFGLKVLGSATGLEQELLQLAGYT